MTDHSTHNPSPLSSPRLPPLGASSTTTTTKLASNADSAAFEPMFKETQQVAKLFTANGEGSYKLTLSPTCDKGFFVSNGSWTCYRRNYFQLIVTFSLEGVNCADPVEGTQFYIRVNEILEKVTTFKVTLDSRCGSERKVPLVQSNAKREKGSQVDPPLVSITPLYQNTAISFEKSSDPAQTLSRMSSRAIYKRLQFKASTSNSNSKRASSQQHFNIVCEIVAMTESGKMVPVAICDSVDLTVRSRSAAHYEEGGEGGSSTSVGGGGRGERNNPSPSPSPGLPFNGMASTRFDPYGGGFREQTQEGLSPLFSPRSNLSFKNLSDNNLNGLGNGYAWDASPAGFLYQSDTSFSPYPPDFTTMSLQQASPLVNFTTFGGQDFLPPANQGFSAIDLGFTIPTSYDQEQIPAFSLYNNHELLSFTQQQQQEIDDLLKRTYSPAIGGDQLQAPNLITSNHSSPEAGMTEDIQNFIDSL